MPQWLKAVKEFAALLIAIPAFLLALLSFCDRVAPDKPDLVVDSKAGRATHAVTVGACVSSPTLPISASLLDIYVTNDLPDSVLISHVELEINSITEPIRSNVAQQTGAPPDLEDYYCEILDPDDLSEGTIITFGVVRPLQPNETDRFGLYVLPATGSHLEPGIWKSSVYATVSLKDVSDSTITSQSAVFEFSWVELAE